MNSPRTEELLKSQLSSKHTSSDFYPRDPTLINCLSYTYHPHSNECGPRSLFVLSVMAVHPNPSEYILWPYMHHNLAQICQWWTTKTIISSSFNKSPFFPAPGFLPNDSMSSHKDSFPNNLAPIYPAPLGDPMPAQPAQQALQTSIKHDHHPNVSSPLQYSTPTSTILSMDAPKSLISPGQPTNSYQSPNYYETHHNRNKKIKEQLLHG